MCGEVKKRARHHGRCLAPLTAAPAQMLTFWIWRSLARTASISFSVARFSFSAAFTVSMTVVRSRMMFLRLSLIFHLLDQRFDCRTVAVLVSAVWLSGWLLQVLWLFWAFLSFLRLAPLAVPGARVDLMPALWFLRLAERAW